MSKKKNKDSKKIKILSLPRGNMFTLHITVNDSVSKDKLPENWDGYYDHDFLVIAKTLTQAINKLQIYLKLPFEVRSSRELETPYQSNDQDYFIIT